MLGSLSPSRKAGATNPQTAHRHQLLESEAAPDQRDSGFVVSITDSERRCSHVGYQA